MHRSTLVVTALLLTLTVAPLAPAQTNPVIVAVLDSGIDAAHPEFDADQVVAWKDFVNGEPEPYDDHWHGTAVASRVAGRTLGAAPGMALAIGKVLDEGGRGWTRDFIAGIEWAVDDVGADVVTVSIWNGAFVNAADLHGVNAAIEYAHSKGAVIVWIAGNGGQHALAIPRATPPPFPSFVLYGAGSAHALVVGAAHQGGRAASFSNDVPEVLALGVDAPIAVAGGGYGADDGTSYAAPFVAGAAARVISANPTLGPADVEDVILKTARDDPLVPYYEEGYGFVDEDAIARAEAVARGDAALPERPVDDAQHDAFTAARFGMGSSPGAVVAGAWDALP